MFFYGRFKPWPSKGDVNDVPGDKNKKTAAFKKKEPGLSTNPHRKMSTNPWQNRDFSYSNLGFVWVRIFTGFN